MVIRDAYWICHAGLLMVRNNRCRVATARPSDMRSAAEHSCLTERFTRAARQLGVASAAIDFGLPDLKAVVDAASFCSGPATGAQLTSDLTGLLAITSTLNPEILPHAEDMLLRTYLTQCLLDLGVHTTILSSIFREHARLLPIAISLRCALLAFIFEYARELQLTAEVSLSGGVHTTASGRRFCRCKEHTRCAHSVRGPDSSVVCSKMHDLGGPSASQQLWSRFKQLGKEG